MLQLVSVICTASASDNLVMAEKFRELPASGAVDF